MLGLWQRGHIQSAEDWEEECLVMAKAEGHIQSAEDWEEECFVRLKTELCF